VRSAAAYSNDNSTASEAQAALALFATTSQASMEEKGSSVSQANRTRQQHCPPMLMCW
jgi:hypothetical protein